MWEVAEWMMLFYIVIGGVWDIWTRTIPVGYLCIGVCGVMIELAAGIQKSLFLALFGAFTGCLFLVLSRLTKEGIGYGDSWLIFILGIHLGVWKLLVVLAVSFLCAAVIAGIGMKVSVYNRKTRIPFLPFLCIGYLTVLGW